MIHLVCAVRDSAAGLYGRLIQFPSKGAAIRSFTDEVNRKGEDNAMHSHPEDFELFELGTFDDQHGHSSWLPSPLPLIRAKDVVS